jgi:ubiquinone/menaquinone biosynthesis C-methylase UbiE
VPKARLVAGSFVSLDHEPKTPDVNRVGLSHVVVENGATTLDVGCGSGGTIRMLSGALPEGIFYGIDYSATSVAASRRCNARAIQSGRVDVQQADVSRLPFPDGMFDLVTAVETHYYWPDLLACMREILRVLKPAGRVVVIAESYKEASASMASSFSMRLLRAHSLTAGQHRELFMDAGFAEAEIHEEQRQGWICGVATKPVSMSA